MGRRVFIVEDHEFFRDALLHLLRETAGVEVCGFSATAEEALEQLAAARADLAVVDLSLPRMNGFDFGLQMKQRFPQVACVMLSGHCTRAVVERARLAGFAGYIVKGDATLLKNALLDALAGKACFPDMN